MTSDPDIYRAANLLIDQHGVDVGLRAAERADCWDLPYVGWKFVRVVSRIFRTL